MPCIHSVVYRRHAIAHNELIVLIKQDNLMSGTPSTSIRSLTPLIQYSSMSVPGLLALRNYKAAIDVPHQEIPVYRSKIPISHEIELFGLVVSYSVCKLSKSSAAFERGEIEHGNGRGWLQD